MNAYGWTLKHAMSHTLYQIEAFSKAIHRRRYDEYLVLSNISRISQTDNKGYQEFIEGLKKIRNGTNKKAKSESSSELSPALLEGFRIGSSE